MSRLRLCVLGDALLDLDWEGDVRRVCRDSPAPVVDSPREHARPGGAALAAVLATTGAEVTLVTALSGDPDGQRLARLLATAGVEVVDLGLDAPTPVKLRLRSGGQSLARVDRGCDPVIAPGPWTAAATAAVAAADAMLVSDYGRGLAALPQVEGHFGGISEAPVVWDPHADGPAPPPWATLATPNLVEARALAGRDAGRPPARSVPDIVALADDLCGALGCAVAVTVGERGAVLAEPRALPVVVPTRSVPGDPCGAGDAFAAHAAVALAAGLSRRHAVEAGVAAAGSFIADRAVPEVVDMGRPATAPDGVRGSGGEAVGAADGAVVPLHTVSDAASWAAAVGRAGGVVVAAGGCFDVLHAGHVRLLEQARALGDHLVVLVNGDASVRRLKGPGRPLNPASDRVAVLRSLACVDEVVVFDEDTPSTALTALRPHLFVKGADYEGADLEEREVLARWGGQVVLVPLVAGRSTTRLIGVAAAAGA